MLCGQRMIVKWLQLRFELRLLQIRHEIINTQESLFLPRTIRDWNDLPQEVIEAKTIDTFASRASKLQ